MNEFTPEQEQRYARSILGRVEKIDAMIASDKEAWYVVAKVYGKPYIYGLSDDKLDKLYREVIAALKKAGLRVR